MNFREKIAEIALKEVGQKEEGGNNLGPAVVKYQTACIPTMYPSAYPWCAAFPCWVIQQVLSIPEIQDSMNLTPQQVVDIRPRQVGTYGWLDWALKHPELVKVYSRHPANSSELPLEAAKQADVVIYDFQQDGKDDHVGIVVSDQESLTSTLHTVEGNVGIANVSDGKGGEGVAEKQRNEFIVSHLIRWLIPEETA